MHLVWVFLVFLELGMAWYDFQNSLKGFFWMLLTHSVVVPKCNGSERSFCSEPCKKLIRAWDFLLFPAVWMLEYGVVCKWHKKSSKEDKILVEVSYHFWGCF